MPPISRVAANDPAAPSTIPATAMAAPCAGDEREDLARNGAEGDADADLACALA